MIRTDFNLPKYCPTGRVPNIPTLRTYDYGNLNPKRPHVVSSDSLNSADISMFGLYVSDNDKWMSR